MNRPFETTIDLFERSTAKFFEAPLFGTKTDEEWRWTNYRDFHDEVRRLRGGIAALGVVPGDKIAIVSNNRLEWAAAMFAIQGLGAAIVPMYEAQLPKEWKFILGDSGARGVFAGSEVVRKELDRMKPELPALNWVSSFVRTQSDALSYGALLERGEAEPADGRKPTPDSLAAIIYTSGTTGAPKGVLLSHGNIASNVSAVVNLFDFGEGDRSLSFLPWAHAFGQTCELLGMLSKGVAIAINQELPKLLDDLQTVKPTILIAVPRVFTRIHTSIEREIDAKPSVVRKLVRLGIDAALRRSRGEHLGLAREVGLAIDERVVFKKIRDKLGGQLRYAMSGAASLNVEVAHLIDAVGIAVYEGYGLSEASPIVSVNYPGSRKLGSVGKVIDGTRVRIAPATDAEEGSGEIVVYGPGVMKGYHNRPDENARAFDADGGLKTGDLGRIDSDGYLFITGRIKEQYKLENGKYVMPGPLEEELKLSRFISNVMLYGDNRPYNVALVVPDRTALEEWSKSAGIALDDVASNPAVIAVIEHELAEHSRGFKPFEVPQRCAITSDEFTIENGMLTPTLKLKRNAVLAKYAATLSRLYERREPQPAIEARAP